MSPPHAPSDPAGCVAPPGVARGSRFASAKIALTGRAPRLVWATMRTPSPVPTRREFLQATAGAGATLFGLTLPAQMLRGPRVEPLKILVLGGTGFLGPAVVRPALARGHTLTLFNRGRSRKQLFPEVERILGDQDPAVGEGLKNLEAAVRSGRRWDAVIDDIAYYPAVLQPRLDLLQKATDHYVIVSSISAYASTAEPDQDEDAPLAEVDDEERRTMGRNYEFYGGLKVACERRVARAFPERTTIVRPGYIVGPEDPTDRFTYWPVRFARGGEMLWPGTPDDKVQIIDVRDLGEWIVHLVEQRTLGTFNACGPAEPWTMGGLLAACRSLKEVDTEPVWVPTDFLAEHRESGEGALPIWAPPTGATAGFHRFSNARAKAAGLKFRPPEETTRDTFAWFDALPAERTPTSRDNVLRAGPKPEQEAKLLAAWRARQGGK